MEHEEARELLSDFRDGELPEEARHALTRHLAACEECRRTLESFDRLGKAISQAAWKPSQSDADRLAAQVLRKLRRQEVRRAIREVLLPRWFAPALGLAFAALLLSFLPLPMESADAAPAYALEENAADALTAFLSSTRPQTYEEALQLLLEER